MSDDLVIPVQIGQDLEAVARTQRANRGGTSLAKWWATLTMARLTVTASGDDRASGQRALAHYPTVRGLIARGLRPGVAVAVVAVVAFVLPDSPAVAEAGGFAGERTVRASVSAGAGQGSASSADPHVSANGRYVAFVSAAPQPGAGRHQRRLATSSSATAGPARTERVSVVQRRRAGRRPQRTAGAISADGRFVAFTSLRHQPGARRHQRRGRRVRPRPPDGHDRAGQRRPRAAPRATATAASPALSRRRPLVAFVSDATNLVPGDTNGLRTSSCATGRPARPSG